MGNKLLIIGASGELGFQIAQYSHHSQNYYTYYSNKRSLPLNNTKRLDITNCQDVENLVARLEPDIIINTSVSDRSIKSLDERDARQAIVDGAYNVAKAGQIIGAKTLHISTDLVFDGAEGNYNETSKVNPLSIYGKYKAEMEERLLALDYDLIIIRTSLIVTFEPMGHQVSWIVNSIKQNIRLNLFTDEIRSPVLGEDLAKAILEISGTDYRGLINIVGPEPINRYSLGLMIANFYKLDNHLINPVLSASSKSRRPSNCTLDNSLACGYLHTKLRKLSEIV